MNEGTPSQRTDTERTAARAGDGVAAHVGGRIRHRREALNLDRRALAKRLGVAPRTLDGFEAGSRRIGPVQLVILSNALNVGIDYFFAELPRVDPVESVAEAHGSSDEYRAFVEAYFRIADTRTRRDFFKLVRAVAERY